MSKIIICLAFALFVSAQAATQASIPLPLNPVNLNETILDLVLPIFIKEQQEAHKLPQENFAIERKWFGTEKVRTPYIYNSHNVYDYVYEVSLKTASKTQYDIRIQAQTDLQNKTLTMGQSKIYASYKFDLWPSVIVTNNTKANSEVKVNTSLFIGNTEYADKIFVMGMKLLKLPNIYYEPIGHKLTQVIFEYNDVNYIYEIAMKDLLTGAVHEETTRIGFMAYGQNPANMPAYVYGESIKGMINPPVDLMHVKLVNTTQLTYNPLFILWNEDLLIRVKNVATTQIIKDAFELLKEDVTERVEDQYEINVEVTNTGVEYELFNSLYEADESLRRCVVKVHVNPADESTTVVSHHVGEREMGDTVW